MVLSTLYSPGNENAQNSENSVLAPYGRPCTSMFRVQLLGYSSLKKEPMKEAFLVGRSKA